jgi:molybdopterin synthase sulfur carrier subunit
MKITLKLFASLGHLLPPGAPWHGVETEVPVDATPNQIIEQFHVPRPMAHLVLQNGVYLAPKDRDLPVLSEGDVLAVWPPIAGG